VSVAVACALFAVVVASASAGQRGATAALDGLAVALLLGGIVASAPVAIWAAVALLGLAGAVADAPAAPLYALALFTVAECALWSTDDRYELVEDNGIRRDRLLLLTGIGAVSLALGAGLRALAHGGAAEGNGYTVVAAACIVSLAALIVAVARHVGRPATDGPAART
jgi:hypothetical protein